MDVHPSAPAQGAIRHSRNVFSELRRHNQRRAKVARLLEARLERQVKIARVLQAQRQSRAGKRD